MYSQKSHELLEPRQSALFVIPRTALRRGTKTVRGKFVDELKNGCLESSFVAAEVARDVRYDVRAGTLDVKADGRRPRCYA